MIVIYTHTITPRVSYAMDLVFGTVLNLSFQLTQDEALYKASSLPKLAYAKLQDGACCIEPEGLLFETGIRERLPEAVGNYLGFPVFFPSPPHSLLPYDLFATVFYFASRYEEYLPSELDVHQRFQAENSLAYRHGFLNKPFLNYLIDDFAQQLKQQYPVLEFKKRTFNFLSTIDIDNAFAYANKGVIRNTAAFYKELLTFKWQNAIERVKSNFNDEKDPYNTFELIHSLSQKSNTALQYFVLIGDYARYDKNPHHDNPGFKRLLKNLSQNCLLGLHPSYQAYDKPERIDIERKRLEEIVQKPITSARCHFLRVNFPQTYRNFIDTGITDDYTMLYASQCGFRSGLCVPYKWFDLLENQSTALTIHSSTVMEGVLRDYNDLAPDEAVTVIKQLMNEVKKFGGEFVSVWHNDSFVVQQKEWIGVYKKMLIQGHDSTTH